MSARCEAVALGALVLYVQSELLRAVGEALLQEIAEFLRLGDEAETLSRELRGAR